jgi:predicted ribosomally synthesized peptide with nif11-like leader
MPKQTFDDFLAKLQQDVDLRREFTSRFGTPEEGVPAKELAAFAAGKGYQFDVADVSSQLSDAQLDAVAGGLAYKIDTIAGSLAYKFVTPNTLGTDLYIKFDGLGFKL